MSVTVSPGSLLVRMHASHDASHDASRPGSPSPKPASEDSDRGSESPSRDEPESASVPPSEPDCLCPCLCPRHESVKSVPGGPATGAAPALPPPGLVTVTSSSRARFPSSCWSNYSTAFLRSHRCGKKDCDRMYLMSAERLLSIFPSMLVV